MTEILQFHKEGESEAKNPVYPLFFALVLLEARQGQV